MKKIILGMFVFALFASVSVFAETAKTKKTVDVSCVSTAVMARETAVLSAWSSLSAQITEALENRKEALASAWSIEDAKERKTALKEVWKNAKKERKEGSVEYKKEKKEAWATYKKAVKACGGAIASEAAGESSDTEKIEI